MTPKSTVILIFVALCAASSFGIGAGAVIGNWYGWGAFGTSCFLWAWSVASIIGVSLEDDK